MTCCQCSLCLSWRIQLVFVPDNEYGWGNCDCKPNGHFNDRHCAAAVQQDELDSAGGKDEDKAAQQSSTMVGLVGWGSSGQGRATEVAQGFKITQVSCASRLLTPVQAVSAASSVTYVIIEMPCSY